MPKGEGRVKDTRHIADVSQVLMHLYNVNPESNKYLLLKGTHYLESHYPDILDEANWGLQYLVTVQQPNGAFPAGIAMRREGVKEHYTLEPETAESTAHAIMALATGVRAFKKEELSMSVTFLRAAEKGWRYLRSQHRDIDPQLLMLASAALYEATGEAAYYEAYEACLKDVNAVSPEIALLMGPKAKDLKINGSEPNFDSQSPSDILPALVQLQQDPGNTAAANSLGRWVTNLYGYTEVALVRDPELELVSAWVDPLQWMATKTGEVASRVGYKLAEEGIVHGNRKVDADKLKAVEEKELEARKRIEEGYNTLSLGTMDKARLAYMLALLNQHISFSANPEDEKLKKQQEAPPEYTPGNSPKGFWRPEI